MVAAGWPLVTVGDLAIRRLTAALQPTYWSLTGCRSERAVCFTCCAGRSARAGHSAGSDRIIILYFSNLRRIPALVYHAGVSQIQRLLIAVRNWPVKIAVRARTIKCCLARRGHDC